MSLVYIYLHFIEKIIYQVLYQSLFCLNIFNAMWEGDLTYVEDKQIKQTKSYVPLKKKRRSEKRDSPRISHKSSMKYSLSGRCHRPKYIAQDLAVAPYIYTKALCNHELEIFHVASEIFSHAFFMLWIQSRVFEILSNTLMTSTNSLDYLQDLNRHLHKASTQSTRSPSILCANLHL